jgi:hypothetical protein
MHAEAGLVPRKEPKQAVVLQVPGAQAKIISTEYETMLHIHIKIVRERKVIFSIFT